jgi:hypothetical protein
MKSVVPSLALRIVYLLMGGIPALYLAALCAVFFPSTFWAVTHTPDVQNQPEALFALLVLALAILGTFSGWLVFFAVGTSSRAGRVLHYIAIGGGIFAAVAFVFSLPVITPSNFLLVAAPTFVGCCLLFHLWRAAQPIIPPNLAHKAARGR